MWREKVIGYLCDFIKRILLATCHLDEQTADWWAAVYASESPPGFDSQGERHKHFSWVSSYSWPKHWFLM